MFFTFIALKTEKKFLFTRYPHVPVIAGLTRNPQRKSALSRGLRLGGRNDGLGKAHYPGDCGSEAAMTG